MLDRGMIYYVSSSNVDSIYRRVLGAISTTQTTVAEESTAGIGATLGLTKIFKALGMDVASIEMKSGGKQTHSRTTVRNESSDDRALQLFRHHLSADSSSNVILAADKSPVDRIFSFVFPSRLKYAIMEPEKVNGIGVAVITPELRIRGVTSLTNWISRSLASNLVWASGRSNVGVPMAGVFDVLHSERTDGYLSLTVQYLILCDPEIFG